MKIKETFSWEDYPTAFITRNKQRLKQFDGRVYLKDGDNFEIELFNPTRGHLLAKIKLNGELLHEGGLVLRPGERVFLERFLDTPNKFEFNTYEVGNTAEVRSAIAYNGLVEVSFCKEYKRKAYTTTYAYSNPTPVVYYNNPIGTGSPNFGMGQSITIASPPTTLCSVSGGTVTTGQSAVTFTSSNMGAFNCAPTSAPRKIETGIAEKGEYSCQVFGNSYREFESASYHNVEWQILPQSRKPLEAKDLAHYCTNCGSRIKKSTYKFCPHCGTKLE